MRKFMKMSGSLENLEILPPGGLFSFENFSKASQSLTVANANAFSQYHLFSETCKKISFITEIMKDAIIIFETRSSEKIVRTLNSALTLIAAR